MNISVKAKVYIGLFLVLTILFTTYLIVARARANDVDWETDVYIVEKGDSLWKIASIYCPDFMNMQDYIHMLIEENNIGRYIYPGDRITVFIAVDKD